MKILFLGDVMGRAGRDAVAECLPALRRDWKLDFVVVNGENATSGVGLSAAHAKGLLDAGMVQASLIDFHCEATSEKMAAGHYCDGRASIVVGTHTHVPTADAQILPGGCAFQSDAGMCGDYDSVIGMQKEEPLRRFVTGMPKGRFQPALGEATLCGLYVETDDRTGRATRAVQVRQGGRLEQAGP